MTTLRTRAIVSLAAAATLALALGGCVRGARAPVSHGPAALEATPLAIRFDNDAREHVHVYLVGEKREWLLGRVEPGAHATLRIPEASLAGSPGFVRLAVLTGQRLTLQAARNPHATLTIAQPPTGLLSQRWTFVQGQLTSLPVGTARVDVGRP